MLRPVKCRGKFEGTADAAINSMTLRAILQHTRESVLTSECGDFVPFFSKKPPKTWGVRIEDQHYEGESEPHYILEVGVGEYEKDCVHAVYEVNYCDFHSEVKDETREGNAILLNPGKYTIHIWLPGEYADIFGDFADIIHSAYYHAMEIALPDFFIQIEGMHREGIYP